MLTATGCLDGHLTDGGSEGVLEVAQTVDVAGTPGLRFERRRRGEGDVLVQVVNRTGRTIDTLLYAYGARVPGQSGTCVSPVPLAPAATATGIAAGARATLEPDAAATSLVVIRVRFGDGTGSPPADGRWRGAAQVGTAATRPLDGEVRVDGVAAFIVGPTEQYRAAPGTPLGAAPAVLRLERFNCYLLTSTPLLLDATEPLAWRADSIVGTWRDPDGVPHRLGLARQR